MVLEARHTERREAATNGWWRRVFRLVAEDLRRNWISYPVTGLVAFAMGLLAVSLVSDILELEGFGAGARTFQEDVNGFVADAFFLAVTPALGINYFLNKDYGGRYRRDNMSRRLAFLRSLPASAGEIVAARMLAVMLALVVFTPLFFLPVYLTFPEVSEFPDLLGFAAIWLGYALAMAGFYTYGWLGFSGREDLRGTIAIALGYPLIAALANFVLGVHLVAGSIEVARTDGPLVTILVPAVGAACFLLWGLVTTRRLRGRDLSV